MVGVNGEVMETLVAGNFYRANGEDWFTYYLLNFPLTLQSPLIVWA